MRYEMHVAIYENGLEASKFIRDNKTGELIKGKNGVLRTFKTRKACQKEVEKLNRA